VTRCASKCHPTNFRSKVMEDLYNIHSK
jgi:hypothetical protein